jgi:DNA-binding NtrC family response regulator
LKELEQDAAKQALAFFAGNKKQAAKALGVSRSHLYKLLDPKPPPFPEPTTK